MMLIPDGVDKLLKYFMRIQLIKGIQSLPRQSRGQGCLRALNSSLAICIIIVGPGGSWIKCHILSLTVWSIHDDYMYFTPDKLSECRR